MSCFNKDEKFLLGQVAGSAVGRDLLEEKICNATDIANDATSRLDNMTTVSVKSYTFAGISATSGSYYVGGFYDAPDAAVILSNASPTQTYGTANLAYAAHAFIVASGPGNTDSGDLVLTVSGTSITDLGIRTPGDSEIVVADCTAVTTNQYLETAKKWIGTVTYTLTSSTGTAFSFDFNYGYAKYEDIENTNFTVTGFECVGLGNANDFGFNIELLHHKSEGWVYDSLSFIPGAPALISMSNDHGPGQGIGNGIPFAYKRTKLATPIGGANSEGTIIKITTGTSNSVNFMDIHLGYC
jgi:hypothetical protein